MVAFYTQDTSVGALSGVGKTRESQLAKLGITTLRDLIYHFPRSYENRGNIKLLGAYDTENYCSYILTVANAVSSVMVKKGMTISKFRAFDESGSCEIVFFNSPFVKDVFHVGSTFRFYAKASFSKTRRLTLTSPKYEPYIEGVDLDDFKPIYALTDGITSKQLEKLIKTAVDEVVPKLTDPLPEAIRLQLGLPTLSFALKNIHFPKNFESVATAAKRLAFDEMLYFGLGISITSMQRAKGVGATFEKCDLKPFTDLLPYELTNAQKNAINDVYRDTVIKKDNGITPLMARILIGDVGSGKTVCAAAAMYIAYKSGYQSAIMVPTEILAQQHYNDLSSLMGRLGINVRLLTGSTTQARKRKIYEEIELGDAHIVVGTHALLSDKVIFDKLGLIVTDEQHRFGVAQRAILKEKETSAHMLVMSATPIPRTLALAMYGDLDISKIDELPVGRMPVDTFVVDESYRNRLNEFIRKQISLGGQCYVVCPAIDESDTEGDMLIDSYSEDDFRTAVPELKNVISHTDELAKALPDLSIACLHGRMKAAEKDAIISRFVNGEIQVLVSTTVIEVGVNVPNASLMIIENAERFGLSQLHQLRGRVGRGSRKSYCVLVSDAKGEKSLKRLEVMKNTHNGFEIAEQDLVLRGPGEFFSSNSNFNLRQSGGLEFKMAAYCNDSDIMSKAFSTAKMIVEKDPELKLNEHALLKEEISNLIYKASTIS